MKYTFLEKITHLGVFKYLEKKRFIQYALDFEQTLRQLEEYLHISDDQEEIINGTLETACEFYQGDWCGFIEVDMDLGLWTTTEWFNKYSLNLFIVFFADQNIFVTRWAMITVFTI